jgi:hypothetical protein
MSLKLIPDPVDDTGVPKTFWSRIEPEPTSGCWLWVGPLGSNGYGGVFYRGKMWGCHRLVWTLVHGSVPKGLVVCHRCDVRCCVNPAHMYLATQSQNILDSHERKRGAHCERHGMARLSAEQVRDIRASPEPRRNLASAYDVSSSLIGMIKSRKRWGRLQ